MKTPETVGRAFYTRVWRASIASGFAACLALLFVAGPVRAFETTPDAVRWDNSGPVEYRMQADFGGGLDPLLLQNAVRGAFKAWATIPDADVAFEEGGIFTGPACPHALPADTSDELISDFAATCGGSIPEVDGVSAVFFIEEVWPFDQVVIGLTTITWNEDNQLVDADIALNGVDYVWSLSDSEVQTDVASIVLHEVGHLLGLAHTTAPDAVMRVDYQQGDKVRELGADDLAGLAFLYPCESERCVGGVGWDERGCQASVAGAGWAALALLMLVPILRMRRRALPLLALFLVPVSATSTTVAALDLDDLVAHSDAVVRVRVDSVESWRTGAVWSAYDLEILEVLAGDAPARVTIEQPGGESEGWHTHSFGMPAFEPGQEAVIFLDWRDGRPRVVGLAQGKLSLEPDGALVRDLSGLRLARVGDKRPQIASVPGTLEGLRAALR